MSDKPIFFSWEKLIKHCQYNVYKVLHTFRTGAYVKFTGSSFLLNPKDLLELPNVYDSEIIEYIALAAKRNYFDAEFLHNARLSTYYVEADLTKLSKNRLLKIVGKELLFKFEEKYGNQVWGSSR